MTDFLPKPSGIKVGGLSRKAQKLQALREKAAEANPSAKAARPESSMASMKATKNSFTGKKTPFQRKAV